MWRDTETVPALVVTHDCEWTKFVQYGKAPDYPFAIAPLRKLSAFHDPDKPGLLGTIEGNRVRYLFPLPKQEPLDDAYVADLRLIQPITVGELLTLEASSAECSREPWTCIGGALKAALQMKLIAFYANVDLVS